MIAGANWQSAALGAAGTKGLEALVAYIKNRRETQVNRRVLDLAFLFQDRNGV